MIRKAVDFALNNRFLVLAAALMLFAWGAISFWDGVVGGALTHAASGSARINAVARPLFNLVPGILLEANFA